MGESVVADYVDHVGIAKKLLEQQGEINRLKAKLQRVKSFASTYAGLHSGLKDELVAGIIDIIDNAYEPEQPGQSEPEQPKEEGSTSA